jgi:hypothetical protein
MAEALASITPLPASAIGSIRGSGRGFGCSRSIRVSRAGRAQARPFSGDRVDRRGPGSPVVDLLA